MAVKTIMAPDENAPKYTGMEPSKFKKLVKSKPVIISAIIVSAYITIAGDVLALFSMWLMIIIGYASLYILSLYFKLFKLFKGQNKEQLHFKMTHDYFKNILVSQHGFNVKYEAQGILIDESAKTIAFTLDPEMRPQITVCDFKDVQRWKSYNQSVTVENNYGVTQASNSNYFVSVYIRNPEHPRYDFFAVNDVDADQWVARFDALLN